MEREELLLNFLKKFGWENAERKLLAHDASFRWYDRLTKGNESLVLMNAPIPPENPAQYVFVDEILEKQGLKVPHIYAQDMENGFLLLEDFGDNTFARLISKGADEENLYRQAVDSLIQIQKKFKTNPGLKEYNRDLMLTEVSLLPLWYIKYVMNTSLDDRALNEFQAIWHELYKIISSVPDTLVMLDYHIDNLMITQKNECGLLDFQDARFGPITYDLVSLLEDARRVVPLDLQEKMKEYYFYHMPEHQTSAFKTSYPIMAVQRHTKVIGIFVRLFVRDGKNRYLKFIPFVWQLLEKHLDNPLLKDYKKWLDTYVPTEIRKQIPFNNKEETK